MSDTPLLNSENTSVPEQVKLEIHPDDSTKMSLASAGSALASLVLVVVCALSMFDVLKFGWVIAAFAAASLAKNYEALVAERLLKKYTTYDPVKRAEMEE